MKKIILLLTICFQCLGMENETSRDDPACCFHYSRPGQQIIFFDAKSLQQHYKLTALSVENPELSVKNPEVIDLTNEEEEEEIPTHNFYNEKTSLNQASSSNDDFCKMALRHRIFLMIMERNLHLPNNNNYYYYDIRPELVDPKPPSKIDSSTVNRSGSLEELAEIASQQVKYVDQQPKRRQPRRKRFSPYQSDYSSDCITQIFPCPLCKKSFGSYDNLFNHLSAHNTNNNYCSQCNIPLSADRTFCNHILRKHNHHEFFECGKCSKKLKTLDDYVRHRWLHNKNNHKK